jgi:hypothetical protein
MKLSKPSVNLSSTYHSPIAGIYDLGIAHSQKNN